MTSTADVLDAHAANALVCRSELRQFGGVSAFEGVIATVRCHEDNVLVRSRLSEPGEGRVLVVDGGGSLEAAIVGDMVAGLAVSNGWSGLVLNACVRDVAALRELAIGIKALGSHPRPSRKDGAGDVDVPVEFGGVLFRPGWMLYSDDDGVVALEP